MFDKIFRGWVWRAAIAIACALILTVIAGAAIERAVAEDDKGDSPPSSEATPTPTPTPSPAASPAPAAESTPAPDATPVDAEATPAKPPDDGLPPIEAYLNIRRAVGPTWSPDGQSLVYLSNDTGTYQAWKIAADGGEPVRLTQFENTIGFVEYLPNARRILFGMDEGGNERTQIYIMNDDGMDVVRLTSDENVIHTLGAVDRDGKRIAYASNARDQRYFDVYVMDLATRQSRLVLQQDAYNEAAAFSPDGKFVVVSTWESNFNNNLTLVEMPSLADQLLTPHSGWATYTDIAWPPGADAFYLISNLGQDWSKVATLEPKERELAYKGTGKWDAQTLAISRDGSRLAYTLNVNGQSTLALVDLKQGKPLPVPAIEEGIIGGLEFSPDSNKLAFHFSSPTRTHNVWIADLAANTAAPLTDASLAGIDPATFVSPRQVRYRGHDDLVIPAFLYVPPGESDGPRGVVVYAHGGPEAQERPDFSGLFQYLLSRGIAIFAPNVRGSTGYGKTYEHLDDKRLRRNSLRDYAAGVEFLKSAGGFDAEKIGIFGGSYGGYVVLGSLAEYPELFACGVSVVGISNFVTFLENTGAWRRTIREAEYGTLAEDREFLESISPTNQVDTMRAPLMVIQGANDPRVPASESDQMVAALRERGREVSYLLYPDEGHGLAKLKNRLDAYPKVADFLRKCVADPAGALKTESDVEKSSNSAPDASTLP
ncbi:S9 family peptidase [bacterium]|nr:S9 family peptidase [bacterium]